VSEIDLTVSGDEDQWILLERSSSDGFPLIVRRRINPFVDQFAEANRIFAAVFDIYPDHVRDDGLPTCVDELHRLEDIINDVVTASGITAYHTASVTGDGRRTQYFATSLDVDASRVVPVIASSFGELVIYDDLDFNTYRDFVTPTALDKQLDGDQSVISNIEKKGDDGTALRKIDFWFYGTRLALEAVVQTLASRGFAVDHWLEEPSGVVLSYTTAAIMNYFRELTPLLIDTARDIGVEYDGWETPLISTLQLVPPAKKSLIGRLFGQKKH